MEACVEEDLPPTSDLEEGLRNGVFLAKLAHFFRFAGHVAGVANVAWLGVD